MDLLTTKNRYHSGVLEIAKMTAPGDFSCKYDCYYCPNQPVSHEVILKKNQPLEELLSMSLIVLNK